MWEGPGEIRPLSRSRWCAWHADLLVGCRSRTGASPLYENESLKEGSIPAVTPIDQVLDEGNCGEVTNRGKAARECAVKLSRVLRRQPHSHQSCEATNRNLIEGRIDLASEPSFTKPFSFSRFGKSRASAVTVDRLTQGSLPRNSVSRACPKAEPCMPRQLGGGQQSAEVIVLNRRTPAATGRTEP